MCSFIDSHAHLNMREFKHDRHEVISKAFKSGIDAILCPIERSETDNTQITLKHLNTFPNIIAAAGIHPHQAKNFSPQTPRKIESLAQKKQIHAVGEIGLDFFYNFSTPECQIKVFREQLNIAKNLKLPVVIHSRLAGDTVTRIIKEEGFTQGGVLHCFTENWDMAQVMLDLNFYISFSGILTFPKAHSLRETAKKIPLNKLLVETDSPFLVPVPFRGKIKRNEPVYVKETTKFLAELITLPTGELTEAISQNFENCFGFEIMKL